MMTMRNCMPCGKSLYYARILSAHLAYFKASGELLLGNANYARCKRYVTWCMDWLPCTAVQWIWKSDNNGDIKIYKHNNNLVTKLKPELSEEECDILERCIVPLRTLFAGTTDQHNRIKVGIGLLNSLDIVGRPSLRGNWLLATGMTSTIAKIMSYYRTLSFQRPEMNTKIIIIDTTNNYVFYDFNNKKMEKEWSSPTVWPN